MPRASSKTEGGRVGKKLGETQGRTLDELLQGGRGANLGEFLQEAFIGAGGAKRVGRLFGHTLRSRNLKKAERLELTKALANLTVQWERMNPALGNEELVRLTKEQILYKLEHEFGLVPRAKTVANDGGSGITAEQAAAD